MSMKRNTQENEYIERAHSYAAAPKSPTLTADAVRQSRRASPSVTNASSTRVQTHGLDGQQMRSCDSNLKRERGKEHAETNRDSNEATVISIKCCDIDKGQPFQVNRSCTVDENKAWQYIVHSHELLHQLNVILKEKLGISVSVTADAELHFREPMKSKKDFIPIVDRLIEIAVNTIGSGIHVTETKVPSEKVGMVISAAGVNTERVSAETIGELQESPNRDMVVKNIAVSRKIWYKVANLIKLDYVLREHCECRDLQISLSSCTKPFSLSLRGPEAAVAKAETEFLNLDQRLRQEHCTISVTSKFAFSELQVENYLDEYLNTKKICCVTQQEKYTFSVFGFSDECVSRAKKEVEEVILEKITIVQGHLKQRKELLVSHLRSRWPNRIVIHIEDSGFLYIVGIKNCVEETFQMLSNLKHGYIDLEDISEKQCNYPHGDDRSKALKDLANHGVSSKEADSLVNDVLPREDTESFEKSIGERNVGQIANSNHRSKVGNVEHRTKGSDAVQPHESDAHDTSTVKGKPINEEINLNGNQGDGSSTGNIDGNNAVHRGSSINESVVKNICLGQYNETSPNVSIGENRHGKHPSVVGNMDSSVKTEDIVINRDSKQDRKHDTSKNKPNVISNSKSDMKYPTSRLATDNTILRQTVNEGKRKQIKSSAQMGEHSKHLETITEVVPLTDRKIKHFLSTSEGKLILNKCVDDNNVTIQMHIDHGTLPCRITVREEMKLVPVANCERKATWQTKEQKEKMLIVGVGNAHIVSSTARTVSVIFKASESNKGPNFTQEGLSFVIHVPYWINGKGQDHEQLIDGLTKFIIASEKRLAEHVRISLECVNNWPEWDFITRVISMSVEHILLNPKSTKPRTVALSLENDDRFEQVIKYTCRCIGTFAKAKAAKRNQLMAVVIPGELDKAKADVIVNTTSRDLDLSNGKVSATLLKAAGGGIQKECLNSYPHGISRLEVAVTGGHRLQCDKVFHIALDRYLPQKEMDSIQAIRSLILTCLKKASELNLTSIAFPAIGTGILKYPIDLVAATMFEGVERFKREYEDTTLTSVMFVIYPTDWKVMKVFKKNEDNLVKPPEEKMDKSATIQLEITGLPDDVLKTKAHILDTCEDKVTDPNETQEEIYPAVTRQVYVVLCDYFRQYLQTLKARGIRILHEDTILRLTGTRKCLKGVADKLKDALDRISEFYIVSLSVHGHDIKAAEKDLHSIRQIEGVACVLDNYFGIVQFYGFSISDVLQIKNALKVKLAENSGTKSYNEMENICEGKKGVTENSLKNFENEPQGRDRTVSTHCNHSNACVRKNIFEGKRSYNMSADSSKYDEAIVEERTETECVPRKIGQHNRQNDDTHNIFRVGDIVVRVYEADILQLPVDCIVNPANSDLDHSGGLALAIAKAAGKSLTKECTKIVSSNRRSLSVGSVVRTTAGRLNYKCILHAVGPCWHHYKPITEESLMQCQKDLKLTVISCLEQADKFGLKTMAMPAISSGLFSVPKEICAIEYANAILEFCGKDSLLKEVHIVDISLSMIDIIQQVFTMMVVHKKSLDFDSSYYINSPTECTGRNVSLKLTGRDKRKLPKANTEQPSTLDFKTEPYVLIGEKLVCTFTPLHCVQIYHGSMLDLQAIPAVVCCVNRRGDGKCATSKQLLHTNGHDYEQQKMHCFNKKRDFGEIISTAGGKSNFQHILHVITPNKDRKALHMTYRNMFDEIPRKEFSCIAMPLLTTDDDMFEAKDTAVVFLTEWLGFIQKHEKHRLDIHLVLIDTATADLVKCIFKAYFDDQANLRKSLDNHPADVQHDRIMSVSQMDAMRQEHEVVQEERGTDCVICMENVTIPKKLKCGHEFCTDCIEGYFRVKPICPVCGQVCGIITGDQPDGRMEIMKLLRSCAGYEGHSSIAVSYYFPPGIQGEDHPRPGAHYRSISRTGYLPDNKEGREICAMLKMAFERRLVFTIGTSRTTGEEGVITWNDIHHKTDLRPNTQFGYPDESYLQRVREELEVKGLNSDDIDSDLIKHLAGEDFRHTFTTDTSV